MWSPKIPPPFFSNKSLNTNKKCMVWTFLCLKIAILPLPIPERKSHFFNKLLFGDIHVKPSDLERRNRKLSAHDCTGSYQNYFLPITSTKQSTKQPRKIAAMLLVPGHIFFCATLLVMAAWKRSTRIDRSCCGGIITGRFVSLLIKKYQQDKK